MTNEKCNTTFLLKIESLFGAYLALKGNLWITSGLKKSLSIRDQFELKFIRLKYPNKKALIRYKQYGNLLSTISKRVNNFILKKLSGKK